MDMLRDIKATIFGQKKRQFRPANAEKRINPAFQMGLKGRQGRKETRSYEQIQELHSADNLYKDPEFGAISGSLFYSDRNRPSYADDIEWLRPHEICEAEGLQPALFKDGASKFDVVQGNLGDCWLLAAMASISIHSDLMEQVLPTKGDPYTQDFEDNYTGCFLVQLWQYGQWMDVIVDDRLPCINGELIYLHSEDKSEFWSAIIEKAYAKLNGSYEALKGGSTSEAMSDFTGGCCETYELDEYNCIPSKIDQDQLHKTLARSFIHGAIAGASIEIAGAAMEAQAGHGLIAGHAYSLVNALTTNCGDKLVCLRNPWGQVEWEGKWSDDCVNWEMIDEEASAVMREDREDGEFWMEIGDFIRFFSKIELCNLQTAKIDEDDNAAMNWVTTIHEARWLRGVTAGGCTNFMASFWQNPQFLLELDEVDDDPDQEGVGCTFIASLLQKDPNRRRDQHDLLTVGFIIYKLDDNLNFDFKKPGGKLGAGFFKSHRSACRSDFINSREVTKRATLAPGKYVIVPCTFRPNEECQFVLRIFSEKKQTVTSDDDETQVDEQPEDQEEQKPITEENLAIFREFFEKLAGRDRAINAWELQDLLNNVVQKSYNATDVFQLETCRALVALADADRSGRLNFEEFKEIWVSVRQWLDIFKKFDSDVSGKFDAFELRQALAYASIHLSRDITGVLVIRYAETDSDNSMSITLSDFVLMGTRLKNAIKKYRKIQPDMTIDEWMMTMLYT